MIKRAKVIFLCLFQLVSVNFLKAQTTAFDFAKADCNGTLHHLFGDLDAGKAVVLFYYMPNCASCPPPAGKIQAMANKIMTVYPNSITAYAFPYNNTTTCSYSSSWVLTNNLPFYFPMDSGAYQVAYYGGFGMPTVVLLGGSDHRVMFSTQSFADGDTTVMRDSILSLFATSGIQDQFGSVEAVHAYPNPAQEQMLLEIQMYRSHFMQIDLLNISGDKISTLHNGIVPAGLFRKEIPIGNLASGIYNIRIMDGQKSRYTKFTVLPAEK